MWTIMIEHVMLLTGLVTGTASAAPTSRMSAGGAPSGARSSACFHAAFLLELGMTKERLLNGIGDLYEVEPNTSCWLWLGAHSHGYGFARIDDNIRRVHRAMYEFCSGPIPEGLCVLHTCDTPACVNPAHLFLGTQAENIADMVSKDRQARGVGINNAKAKLVDSDVLMIRKQLVAGIPKRRLAREFGVAPVTIRQIAKRQIWRHI